MFKAHFTLASKITGKARRNQWYNPFYLNRDTDGESDILKVQTTGSIVLLVLKAY